MRTQSLSVGSPPRLMAVLLAGAAVVAFCNWLALRDPALLPPFTFSSARAAAMLAAAVAVLWLTRHPRSGLVLLLSVTYLNLSQVLSRTYGWPSMLPLVSIPLALAVAFSRPWEHVRAVLRHPATLLLGAYLVVASASTLAAIDTGLADQRLLELAKAGVLFLLVASLLANRSDVRLAAWTVVLCGVVMAALGTVQVVTGNYAHEAGGFARVKYAHIAGTTFEPRITGPLGDPNFFAQILIVLVPFAIMLAVQERRAALKTLASACAALLVTGVILTYSRGGALALSFALLVSLLPALRSVRPRIAIATGALTLVLLATVVPRDFLRRLTTFEQLLPGGDEALRVDTSFEERRLLTTAAWLVFLDHPMTGVGLANYTHYFDRYAGSIGSEVREYEVEDDRHYPHNLYLEVAAESGLPGLLIFSAALLSVVAAGRRAIRVFRVEGDRFLAHAASAARTALVAYLITSLFLHGHFQRYLWLLAAISVALSIQAQRLPRERAA